MNGVLVVDDALADLDLENHLIQAVGLNSFQSEADIAALCDLLR